MKVNFAKVEIQPTVEGPKKVIDFRKPIGNLVWGTSTDIETSDFGRSIYFSDGDLDVPEEMASTILAIIENSSCYAPVKRKFKELLTPKPAKK